MSTTSRCRRLKRSHTMTKLLENIVGWLSTNPQSQLEQFINSKNPTNAAEIDYWTREYQEAQYWGRGL